MSISWIPDPPRKRDMLCWILLLTVPNLESLQAAQEGSIPSALIPVNITPAGHSMLGEAFDEGPRHAASLLGTTGRVSFPISTSNTLAQQFFNQGIGQLHGFWYFEAERSFRQAAKFDPDCAMAYFGMALANTNNEKRARGFIAEAVKRKEKASEREKLYIKALDDWYKVDSGEKKDDRAKERLREYVNALEEILFRFPDDLEAKAMLSLTLWQKRSDLGTISLFAIDALMNDVLSMNQYHPVHHFRIHLWDNDKARMALNSAERCGLSAPGIAHMWHMSGHTYSELEQYFDAAWHQEAAIRTDHAYMMRDGIFPDRIHNFAHNSEWLIKNLQYIGRVRDAITLAVNTIELPRHPKYNPFPGEKSAHFGRLRLYQIYNSFELWDQLIADSKTQLLGPTDDPGEQIKYFRNLGRAYFRQGRSTEGTAQLDILERRKTCLEHETQTAADTAAARARFEGLDAKAIESKRQDALQTTAELTKSIARAVDELQGHQLLVKGMPEEALTRFNKANDLDDIFLAEVEFQAGKREDALKRLQERVNRNKNQVRPLAALIEMQWRHGKKLEAKESLEKLRGISGSIDAEIPSFARLEKIAIECGFSADWRTSKPLSRNAAELPELSTLGPLTWMPTTAADWSLADGSNSRFSLADFQGRPLVLTFYLGAGCLHCVEQLQAFASKHKDYSAAGISLVAITTETPQELKKSQDRYRSADGAFPFQILCDPTQEIFKKYRSFDDFEETPLHATYLIDSSGKIRWHDIGSEPFSDVDFLLQEAIRLIYPDRIKMPVEPTLPTGPKSADALSPRNVFPITNQTTLNKPI